MTAVVFASSASGLDLLVLGLVLVAAGLSSVVSAWPKRAIVAGLVVLVLTYGVSVAMAVPYHTCDPVSKWLGLCR